MASDRTTTPSRESAQPAAAPATGGHRSRIRRVTAGDVGPIASPEAMESYATGEASAAALEAQANALEDILAGRSPIDAAALMRALLKE